MRLLLILAATALAGCAARTPGSTQVDESAATDQEEPQGRPAGVSILQFGSLRTFWLLHCPTDSPSPLRQQCSLTRADVDPSR